MSEGRGVALAILGIVALIAVVGLVLLFSGRLTAKVVADDPIYGISKVYGRSPGEQAIGSENPNSGSWVTGTPYTWEGQQKVVVGGAQADYRNPSDDDYVCNDGFIKVGSRSILRYGDDTEGCYPDPSGDGSYCCPASGLDLR